jgi:hypothetical protein
MFTDLHFVSGSKGSNLDVSWHSFLLVMEKFIRSELQWIEFQCDPTLEGRNF